MPLRGIRPPLASGAGAAGGSLTSLPSAVDVRATSTPRATLARAVRLPTAIRVAAGAALVAGIAAPLARRRLKLPPPVVTGTAALAPLALCVLVPRSRGRDIATCGLQMWAYVATYQMPNDDPEVLERRVHVRYPVVADKR